MIHKQNEMKMEDEMEAMIEDMEKVKKTLKIRIEEFGEEFPSPSAPRIYLDSVDGNFGSQRSLSSIRSSDDSPNPFRNRLGSSALSTTSSLVVEHDDEKIVCDDDEDDCKDSNESYKTANDEDDVIEV